MTTKQQLDEIRSLTARIGRPVRLMEVCGTHTMSAFRSGLRSLLPPSVTLLSGPGCPVCVTSNAYLDRAIALARRPGTMVATFGDMIRVPGTETSLERARAEGAQVRVVYSALDALKMARENPRAEVIFLGVGFETTVPGTAWALREARERVPNFRVLCAHKTMPHAMAALLRGGELRIDGFICPGHVSVIIGSQAYEFICRDFGTPCVVTGFEGADMLAGIAMLLRQLAESRAEVEIQYTRTVRREGNARARDVMNEVFRESDETWRGLGLIPRSGLAIRSRFAEHDAAVRFNDVAVPVPVEPKGCACGDVLRGSKTPRECPLFRKTCTPDHPVGACMVSSEGTCAAYYRYE
ncbi:MAG: Hydrogenase expression/formation protein HypD [Verrucomicrobia bacterium ADurb.Bin345]|nr:MAG: Hydrogenase expression/formation protein HypD [Verrucomicrobia bacterium ADurb.Bin345]